MTTKRTNVRSIADHWYKALSQRPGEMSVTYPIPCAKPSNNKGLASINNRHSPLPSEEIAGIVAGIKSRIPAAMPLTDSQIRNTKPGEKPIKLTDGGGLYLEVRPTGAKLWRYRYRIAGKENVFAVGEYVQAPSGETKEQTQSRRNAGMLTLAEARG
jgi:hypothetical protein